MNIITKGANNDFICTLKEKQTLTSPYFLFEFRDTMGGAVKRFIAFDQSSYTDRYNNFLITEVNGGTENLTSGTVNLPKEGYYKYRVWEQTSSTNLNPDATANPSSPLEIGMMKVFVTPISRNQYSRQSTTFKTYGNGA